MAWLFPGQGSQVVGMGRELLEHYPVARLVFAEASDVLGFNLTRLCLEGPEADLRRTVNAQPVLLTHSVAVARVLQQAGLQPQAVAGHSLGEYSALVVAGAIEFALAVWLVRARGELMEKAVPAGQGGMTAILGLEDNTVEEACRLVTSSAGVVEPANYNCPGQVIISGHRSALEEAAAQTRSMGGRKAAPLNVSGPFHSSLMVPASEGLAQLLAETAVAQPQIPVVANVHAGYYTSAEAVRAGLVEQVKRPVLWRQSVSRLLADGFNCMIEVGVGTVLAGLCRKIDRAVPVYSSGDLPEKVLASLKECR